MVTYAMSSCQRVLFYVLLELISSFFMPPTLKKFFFMPPTLKKLEGHIAFGLPVCVCVLTFEW